MRPEEPIAIRLEDYRPPDWLVDTVHLDIDLHPTEARVIATLKMRPNPDADGARAIVLDGDELKLSRITLDGKTLDPRAYVATPERLTIPRPPSGPITLEIETLLNPSTNTQLMGLYQSNGIYCTQCEAEGFRRITYFPDRPDVMAVYTTRIEADKAAAPILLANGNMTESGDIDNGRHFAVWHDPFPKPSYLFAMVGGDLAFIEDTFRTMSGRDVALKIYVEHGKAHLCDYAMDSLKRSMRWDEEVFGREYDLDIFMIVAVADFNMGAMENKGLNIFNDKYVLASPETATDADYASIEAIVAHEYFHNWTGNRITCRDWFQLCLKEGLTVFRDQEFSADQRSAALERIGDVRNLRAIQFTEDSGPLAHPVRPSMYREINNFYTPTIYEKGAEIIRMLRVMIGREDFRRGMDLYFDRHDGDAATIEQFIACFAEASKRDLTHFSQWYSQAGTPHVAAEGQWNAEAKTYRLDLVQNTLPTPGQPSKEPQVIPLAVALFDEQGRAMKTDEHLIVLDRASQSVEFRNIKSRPVLSINREFSAPIVLRTNATEEDTQVLAAHDTDSFNRWQAIQTLAMKWLVAHVRGAEANTAAPLLDALKNVLADRKLAPAFVAQALAMPTEGDIAGEIAKNVDPDAIFRARKALRGTLSEELRASLQAAYDTYAASRGPFNPDAKSAGERALKNAALDLLAANGDAKAIALAARQFADADNMTDRMAALAALMPHDIPEREQAFKALYDRFENDPLVIDKWLTMQAMVPEAATFDRIKALTEHKAFSFKNPNRVRALIGAFAGNPSQFNRPDGAGYRYLTETAVAIDPQNPQLAARLMGAFKTWRRLEPGRAAAAEAALKAVAKAPNLSRDLADIVGRALAAP
ncbi:aminopeptidase N [Variibacter gotjawalensis]|uniref:Aminopeptidase N n=1 Tax=Variibacter gotjawalensis TaxID=1333996 RepID=A0A0S3PZ45_9BRAD|nr:aminopeptidase N [Variibacter gotjawalensis]NIK47038.1 aminopeptidase N [Variibacter gotjawalensis]RZS48943.1 aminopeptidase N [Variibacter gotjawalensis]BAT61201.1 aminopeptidase N [Variibacter gotjawalensis]